MRNRIWVLVLAVALVSGCGTHSSQKDKISGRPFPDRSKKKVQAILIPQQETWDGHKPLSFVYTIFNGTNKPITFDGGMCWPGNIDVLAETPKSREIRVVTLNVSMSLPSKADMITLPPGNLYGTVIVIDPTVTDYLNDELKNPHPGRYRFWVGGPGYLISNRAEVVVR